MKDQNAERLSNFQAKSDILIKKFILRTLGHEKTIPFIHRDFGILHIGNHRELFEIHVIDVNFREASVLESGFLGLV
jgi:hypothetical protein